MISEVKFAVGMALLADRFGREVSDYVARGYLKVLNAAGMTDQEWEAATEHVFRHGRFFPSPQELIEGARGSAEILAEQQWGELMRAFRDNQKPVLSEVGKRAYENIGGYWTLSNEPIQFSRMQFMKAFKACAQAQDRLALEEK